MSFNDNAEFIVNRCLNTLALKEQEYSSDVSRFHNFDIAARIINTTPEKALVGMWIKHFVSLLDIVESIEHIVPSRNLLIEKVTDSINYIILLYGMIEERRIQCH